MRVFLACLALAGSSPAHLGSGDDVQPRDTVSVVESVSPGLPAGVRVDIVGGDTFVRVRADGHAVRVPGYQSEQYIEISRDGTVRENVSSTTSRLNVNRYGFTYAPEESGKVNWRQTATDGTAMWHDHRVHWMSPSTPAVIDDGGTVQHWTLPVVVDGTTHTVSGTLYLRGHRSPAWWLIGAFAAVIVGLAALRTRRPYHLLLVMVASLGSVTGLLQWLSLPAAARVTPLMLVFSLGSLVAAVGALLPGRRAEAGPQSEWIASSVAAGSGVAMLLASWMCAKQVQSAWVPMTGPMWIARVTVATLAGAGTVAVVDGVLRAVRVQPVNG